MGHALMGRLLRFLAHTKSRQNKNGPSLPIVRLSEVIGEHGFCNSILGCSCRRRKSINGALTLACS